MTDRPRAVVTMALPETAMARLAAACEVVDCVGQPRAVVIAQMAEAEGILCPAPYPIDNELLDAAPRLRVVANFGVGYNNVDFAELDRRGIVCCNTPGVLNDAVADLTLGLILAAAHHFPANVSYALGGGWSRGETAPGLGFDLRGKLLGIVGYGRIGREVAIRARAFGMVIVFNDVFTDPGGGDDARPLSFDDLLRRSDIVTLHTNLTPESRRLVGARELSLMKPSAWLVNTARGPVVDEAALVAALQAGTIAGAALDVTEVEPPAADAPILSAPNVILLPHIGSATVQARAAMTELCVSNLLAVLGRREPPACVNPEVLKRALTR